MPKLMPADPPFVNHRIYGPYEGGSRGTRRIVFIVRPDKSRTSMSYSRYLLCLKEGRLLQSYEEADHIDNDCLNDSPNNLQILTPEANKQKYAQTQTKTMVTLICPGCGEEFTRERRQTHLVKGYKNPTACSRSCATKAQYKAA